MFPLRTGAGDDGSRYENLLARTKKRPEVEGRERKEKRAR